MTDVVLRDLSASELTGPEVRELLRLATDFDDAGLDRVVSDVLPRLTVLAALDSGVPVALAAYAPPRRPPPAGPRPDGGPRAGSAAGGGDYRVPRHRRGAPAYRARRRAHRGDPAAPPARRRAGEH